MNRRPIGPEADDPTVLFSSEKMPRGTFVVPSLLCRACAVDDARKTTTLLVAACGGSDGTRGARAQAYGTFTRYGAQPRFSLAL